MGFVICKCGERISDIVQPNENEGRYASSFVFDDHFCGTVEDLALKSRQMWECPMCCALILATGEGKVRHYQLVGDNDEYVPELFKRHNCQGKQK